MATLRSKHSYVEGIQFLLRIPSSNNAREDFVSAHNEIIERQGCIAFGKFGKPMPNDSKRILEDQKESDISTYLFVATRRAGAMKVFQATISDIIPSLGAGSTGFEVPRYYPERPAALFILSTVLVESSIDLYEVASTRRDAMEALSITRTPLMYICKKQVGSIQN